MLEKYNNTVSILITLGLNQNVHFSSFVSDGAESDDDVWVTQGNTNNNRIKKGILKKTPESVYATT